jgi:AcrR family transcriptional regulator
VKKDPDGGAARRAGDKGHYGRLSRERVLASALELVDREGLSALSMRRLGAQLGVEAMALYRYSPGKDALLDGLVETLYVELGDVLIADTTGPGPKGSARSSGQPHWRAEVHRIARATYRVITAHPHAAPLLATRMLAVPLARRPPAVLRDHERVLALLGEAGLNDHDASVVYRAVTAWVLGFTLAELRATVDDPEEPDPAFRLGLHRMPAREFPRLRAVTPSLAKQGGLRDLAIGLDALLDAFVPPGPTRPARRRKAGPG